MATNWEVEDPATPERVGMLVDDFIQAKGLERFPRLVVALKMFCLREIEKNSDLGSFYTIQDIGPKIWAFYQGFMSCHNYYYRELKVISSELKKLGKGAE